MKEAFIDPRPFGLHPRTLLKQSGSGMYAIIKKRTSRIIMKDGEKILEEVRRIMHHAPGATVRIETNAPVCSKTKHLLLAHGIEIFPLQP